MKGKKVCYKKWSKILKTIAGMCNSKTHIDEVGSSYGMAVHHMVGNLHIYRAQGGKILISDKPSFFYNDDYSASNETYIIMDGIKVIFGVTDYDGADMESPRELCIHYCKDDDKGWLKMPGSKRKNPMDEKGVEIDIPDLLKEGLNSNRIDSDEKEMLKKALKFVCSILKVYKNEKRKYDELRNLPSQQLCRQFWELLKEQFGPEEARKILINAIVRLFNLRKGRRGGDYPEEKGDVR